MDWLTFEGRVTAVEWGRSVYTVLVLPVAIAKALEAAGARRVEGEIKEHPVNLALSRAPVVDGLFLWTGKSLLDRTSIRPGERFEVRLRPAPPDSVETPDDLHAALLEAGLVEAWSALTPGRRRGMLYKLDLARTERTRIRRIAGIVAGLATPPPDKPASTD